MSQFGHEPDIPFRIGTPLMRVPGGRLSATSGNSDVLFESIEATRKRTFEIYPDQLIADTASGQKRKSRRLLR